MMRIIAFLLLFSLSLFSSELSFQVYVYDSADDNLLNSDLAEDVDAMFIDSDGNEYLKASFDQTIANGILHINFTLDFTDNDTLFVFDQPGLSLKVDVAGDSMIIPIYSDPISVFSKMADRVSQISDQNLLYVDYDSRSISIGGVNTSNALVVSGNVLADKFVGDGYYITNVMGLGLNDDHSLESNMSRSLPNKTAESDSDIGDDAIFISNDPRVGIGTKLPEISLDVKGLVLFQDGDSDTGVLNFPLTVSRSMVIWEHTGAAFKAGYVSRDIAVTVDSFSNSSVAIGNDIVTLGWNSAVFGGRSNSVYGDYSAVIGGEEHIVSGNYSVVVGGIGEIINDGYAASVAGQNNVVSSNFTVLLSSTGNVLNSGEYNTIYGSLNTIDGDSNRNTILSGVSNQINDADDVILFGDKIVANYDDSWIVNLSEDTIIPSASNQVVWVAENGISFNTSSASSAFNIAGNIQANYFYGDGSELTNISLVDKYWFMYGNDMTIVDYFLYVNTLSNFGDATRNQLNLNNGIVLGDDSTRDPGTISFDGEDLIGAKLDETVSLLNQNTDSLYTFSSEFEIISDQISLAKTGIQDGHYFIYDGEEYTTTTKNYWVQTASTISYDRPVAFWSNLFDGMVSLMDSENNIMQFANDAGSAGITIQNIPVKFGFNIMSFDTNDRFDTGNPGYIVDIDTTNGNYILSSYVDELLPIMEIDSYGIIDFWGFNSGFDVSIPTQSQVSNLVIDTNVDSQLRHIDLDNPFINSDSSGLLTFQSENESTINFRILDDSGSITTMNRIQITNDGEFLLSDSDASRIGAPMVTIPDGELLLDNRFFLGVYDEDRVLDLGIYFHYSSINFTQEASLDNYLSFGQVGLGVRTVPDSIFNIEDVSDSALFLSKGASKNQIIFTQAGSSRWRLLREFSENDALDFNTYDDNILTFTDSKILLNNPANPSRDLNVEGNIVLFGDHDFSLSGISHSEQPFIQIRSDQANFQPLNSGSGFVFKVLGDDDADINILKIKDNVVGIYNHHPDYVFTVDTGSHISTALYLNDEIIHHKTFNDSIGNSYQEIANLSFADDSGYTTSVFDENTVLLEYHNHFSTFNTVTVDAVIDGDTVMITPNGVDLMGFSGEYISVFATDVLTEANDDYSVMDSLEFYNDLSDGGVINGDLRITATLNVTGFYTKDGVVTSNKFIGDVHQIEDLPFPFSSTNSNVYFNDDSYNYQYIDNVDEKIHVGIRTSDPNYPLEVEGDILVNNLIIPSMNVSGEFNPFDEDWALNFYSAGATLSVTVNASEETVGTIARLNNLDFTADNIAGLNDVSSNYRLTLKTDILRDGAVSDVADMLLHGQDRVFLSLVNRNLDKFQLRLDDDDETFYLDAFSGVVRLNFLAGSSGSVTLSQYHDLGIGILTDALNDLVVSGNLVIGSDYSGVYSADPNSMIVQNKLGVGTPSPLYKTDVRGTTVVGNIDTDLENSLIIESQLFIEEVGTENVVVKGTVGLGGDLFFKDSDNELSFMNGDGEFIIGYSDAYSSDNLRSLNIISPGQIYLYSENDEYGLFVNSSGYVNFGHESLSSNTFYLKMDNLNWKIHQSSTDYGDAQIEFDSTEIGVIGLDSNYSNAEHQYMVISDEEIIDDESGTYIGADIQIDALGNVDIGYNMHDPDEETEMPDDTDTFKLDVKQNVFATKYGKSEETLTHMPLGSIIMWSGWTDELPEGWKLCMGVDDDSQYYTSECNFSEYFMVGSDVSRATLNPANASYVGYDTISVTTVGGAGMYSSFDHTHSSAFESIDHSHSVSGTVTHNHSSGSTADYSGSYNTAGKVPDLGTTNVGERYVTTTWSSRKCWAFFCRTQNHSAEVDNTQSTAKVGSSSAHSHTVDMTHNHGYGVYNESSHKHTMETESHLHDNKVHYHTVDNRPVFYTLAFIYLEGEQEVTSE